MLWETGKKNERERKTGEVISKKLKIPKDDKHTHTFLMSMSLLTLMSMLTGVLGKASKTSLSRGIRLSSPPSQTHSAQTKRPGQELTR